MRLMAALLLGAQAILATPQEDKARFLREHNISSDARVKAPHSWSVTHQRVEHMCTAMQYRPQPLRTTGLHLEFGTRGALMLNWLAGAFTNTTWHGFDSFLGLPPDTRHDKNWAAGKYSTSGALPSVKPNVVLHKGWFNETLPGFLRSHHAPLAFVHMDADIYSSTISVLDALFGACRQRVGTVIAFDEIFGVVSQLEHEYRALVEATQRWGISYRWVSYVLTPSSPYARAAVQVTDVGEQCAASLQANRAHPELIAEAQLPAKARGVANGPHCVAS